MVAVSQSEWPKEISDAYSPVRVIGKGGFASVWMAKKKSGATSVDNNNNDDDHVAVKLMKDDGYAEREIAILSELSMDYPHPNIIRWIFNCRTDTGMNCIVLSLARGPPLNAIISKNGALGLVIAQTISRQLIDVIAYLHGHAGKFILLLLFMHIIIYHYISIQCTVCLSYTKKYVTYMRSYPSRCTTLQYNCIRFTDQ